MPAQHATVRHLLACAVAVAGVLAATLPRTARAEGLSASVEPSYTAASSKNTDQAGLTRDSTTWRAEQIYRAAFDRQLFPLLRLTLNGFYDWGLGTTTADGVPTDLDSRRWTTSARLAGGNQILSYGLGYDRSQQSSSSKTGGVETRTPTLVNDSLMLTAGLKPEDLPQLSLLLSRTRSFDEEKRFADLSTDSAQLTTRYSPSRPWDLVYGARLDHPVEHIKGTESLILNQSARATYSESFRERRLPVYVSYSVSNIMTTTQVTGTGGTFETPRTPTAGLSAIDTFPDTPDRITLPQNPALVDGDLATSASVDLGFARSLAGDNRNRELGAQLADAVTPVTTFYLYVDRQLPPEIVTAMTAAGAWSAYRSDDNVTWTPVPIAGPVVFGTFQNRFEISIPETRSRYLKVVTRPLAGSVTTDQRYAAILVTELQLVEVVPAALAKRHDSSSSGQFAASTRYTIDPRTSLSYDSSLSVTHDFSGNRPRYTLLNGLAIAPRINPVVGLGGRLEWTDSDLGAGREDQFRWGATLTADPLPTLGGTLAYSGLWRHARAGISYSNGATASLRADLYEGISVGGTIGAGLGRAENGQSSRSTNGSATMTLVPHKTMSLAGAYGFSHSQRTGAGLPELTSTSQHVDGTAAWSPIQAVYMSGGVSRVITNQSGVTTGNFAGGVSPFPGGTLQLRGQYAESFDTSSNLRTRSYGPTLRWTVGPSLYVDVSYTVLRSTSSVELAKSHVFFARLFWAVR